MNDHPEAPPTAKDERAGTLPRTLGLLGAAAVMVGVIIGSGIFETPASMARACDSPWLMMLYWVVGGVLALLGAFTFAELASMYPQSGGVYVFLREAFGRNVAFVFGWTYMLLSKPLAAAGMAVVLAKNVNAIVEPDLDERVLTCVVLVILTGLNARGTRLGAGVAGVLTALKVLALVGVVGLTLVAAFGGRLAGGAWDAAAVVPADVSLLDAVIPIMAAVMWTYDGWADVGAIAGEVRDPRRTLARVFTLGTLLVIAIYLAVNFAYLRVLTIEEMRTVPSVAPAVMERLIGPAAGVVVAAMIVLSTLGSTHSSVLTGARVTFQQARDNLLFGFLGRVSARETPAVALWVQCGLSCAAVLYARTFDRLAGGFVFTMWVFYGLAGVAIFVLRARHPHADRPFRCPGYPVVPALFVASAAFMTIFSIAQSPSRTLPWLAVLLAGWPAYIIWERLRARSRAVS